MKDIWSREETQPLITVARSTSWVMLPLLLIFLLINLSVPAAASSLPVTNDRNEVIVSNGPSYYGWFRGSTGNYYTCQAINTSAQVIFSAGSQEMKMGGLAISFPVVDGYDYYVIDIYFASANAGYLYDGYFDKSRVDLISQASFIYSPVVDFAPAWNAQMPSFPRGLRINKSFVANESYINNFSLTSSNFDPVSFDIDFSSEGHGSYNIHLVIKSSDVLSLGENIAGVMFYFSNTFAVAGSNTNTLYMQSVHLTSDLQKTLTTKDILDAIGDAAADIIQNQNNNSDELKDALGENRELFEQFLTGGGSSSYEGMPGLSDFESSAQEYLDASNAVDQQIDSIVQSTIVDPDTGEEYVINMNVSLFESLQSQYSGALSGFDNSTVFGAPIFRKLLQMFIDLFPIQVFFVLTVGMVAAILGRSSG